MKEVRYFYTPEAAHLTPSQPMVELPDEEAQHAVRVLRLTEGDEVVLMDGVGQFYRAELAVVTKKSCVCRVLETLPQQKEWAAHLHLAMAPTKNMDRTEWLAEKATEIGFDELTFLRCQFSERTVIKTERVEKILVSAMKQSRKAWKPKLNEMTDFRQFLQQPFEGGKFICHCYEQDDLTPKVLLKDVLKRGEDALVLVGPEGDFSIEEVRMAEKAGFVGVSLGKSRLRTETAALVAVHLMHLANE